MKYNNRINKIKLSKKIYQKILYNYTGCEITYPKTPNYTKKVDVGNFVVNNSKLRKLGWSPKTSTDIGVKKTLKFFQSK